VGQFVGDRERRELHQPAVAQGIGGQQFAGEGEAEVLFGGLQHQTCIVEARDWRHVGAQAASPRSDNLVIGIQNRQVIRHLVHKDSVLSGRVLRYVFVAIHMVRRNVQNNRDRRMKFPDRLQLKTRNFHDRPAILTHPITQQRSLERGQLGVTVQTHRAP